MVNRKSLEKAILRRVRCMATLLPLRHEEKEDSMSKNIRSAGPLMGMAAVIVLTAVVVQRAYAVTTVPNASKVTFGIPAASFSPLFPLAARDQPVFVMGATVRGTPNQVGTGNASIAYASGINGITWAGVNNVAPGGTAGGLQSTAAGGPMVAIGTGVDLHHAPVGAGVTPPLTVRNNTGTAVGVVVEQIW
jgi:hypothetical protein